MWWQIIKIFYDSLHFPIVPIDILLYIPHFLKLCNMYSAYKSLQKCNDNATDKLLLVHENVHRQ